MVTLEDIKKINSPETKSMVTKKIAEGYRRIKMGKYVLLYDRSGRKNYKHTMVIEHEKNGYHVTAVDFEFNECWDKLIGRLFQDATTEQAA